MTQEAKYSAGSALAGYLFQCRLALLRGLELARDNPASSISIEKFDDVSFENDDIAECLIQAKHHIAAKSLDNMSVDVWKTLGIWVDNYKSGIFQADRTSLFLITTATASEGSALAKLREGASQEDRIAARTILREAAEASVNQSTRNAREEFLKLTDEEVGILLSKVTIYDNHPNLTDVKGDIESELILVAPNNTELAAEYLEGWWLNVVGKHLVEQQNSTVPVQHIITKANEICRTLHEDSLPIDDPETMEISDYTDEDEKRLFVRQLRAIQLADRQIKASVYDYYRAYAQRSKWARENLILEDELGKYDRKLVDSWERRYSGECILSEPETEEDKIQLGKTLFVWASQESVALRNIVEKWITAGSFHGLSDQLRIGWHPDFRELLHERELEDA